MQPFTDLTYRGQFARLRRLALAGLERFPVRVHRMRALFHGENTTFCVDARRGRRRTTERFCLRIHRSGYHTDEGVRVELDWLDRIRRRTDLVVPAPMAGRDGDFLQHATAPGVPETRTCSLLAWVHGRFREKSLTPRATESVGRLVARLQQIGGEMPRRLGRARPRWDAEGLLGDDPNYGSALVAPGLRKKQRRLIDATRGIIADRMNAYGYGRRVFGLIHADLHNGNYVFHHGEVRPIDFDDCGWGHYAYDLAVAVGAFGDHPRFDELREALLDGYTSVRPLSARDLEMIEVMRVARSIVMLGWITSRSDNPGLRRWIPSSIKRTVQRCRALG